MGSRKVVMGHGRVAYNSEHSSVTWARRERAARAPVEYVKELELEFELYDADVVVAADNGVSLSARAKMPRVAAMILFGVAREAQTYVLSGVGCRQRRRSEDPP